VARSDFVRGMHTKEIKERDI